MSRGEKRVHFENKIHQLGADCTWLPNLYKTKEINCDSRTFFYTIQERFLSSFAFHRRVDEYLSRDEMNQIKSHVLFSLSSMTYFLGSSVFIHKNLVCSSCLRKEHFILQIFNDKRCERKTFSGFPFNTRGACNPFSQFQWEIHAFHTFLDILIHVKCQSSQVCVCFTSSPSLSSYFFFFIIFAFFFFSPPIECSLKWTFQNQSKVEFRIR